MYVCVYIYVIWIGGNFYNCERYKTSAIGKIVRHVTSIETHGHSDLTSSFATKVVKENQQKALTSPADQRRHFASLPTKGANRLHLQHVLN